MYRQPSDIFNNTENVIYGPQTIDLIEQDTGAAIPLGKSTNTRFTIIKGSPAMLKGTVSGAAVDFAAHRTQLSAEVTTTLSEVLDPTVWHAIAAGNARIAFNPAQEITIESTKVKLRGKYWHDLRFSPAVIDTPLPAPSSPTASGSAVGGNGSDFTPTGNRFGVSAAYLSTNDDMSVGNGAQSDAVFAAAVEPSAGHNTVTVSWTPPTSGHPQGYFIWHYSTGAAETEGDAELVGYVIGGDTASATVTVAGTSVAFAGPVALNSDLEDSTTERASHVRVFNSDKSTEYVEGDDYELSENYWIRRLPAGDIADGQYVLVEYPVKRNPEMSVRIGSPDMGNIYYSIRLTSIGATIDGIGEGYAIYIPKCFIEGNDFVLQGVDNEFFEGTEVRFIAIFALDADIPCLAFMKRWNRALAYEGLENEVDSSFNNYDFEIGTLGTEDLEFTQGTLDGQGNKINTPFGDAGETFAV